MLPGISGMGAASTYTPPVTLANASASWPSLPYGGYRLTNAGLVQTNDATGTYATIGTWTTDTPANYDVKATLLSGSVAGTTGSFLNLGTTRTWTSNGGAIQVDIVATGTATPIIATAIVTLTN